MTKSHSRYRFGILLLVLLIASLRVSAQTMSVESFKLLPNDLTANTYCTMQRDQNGDVAALIKMVTSETGFVFDGGMMGIVKTEQKTGEVWVYVPHGIQRITISHQQLGVLRDYYFPVPIEKARTYEMRLLSGRVKTVVEDEFAAQYVIFKLNPTNAIVYIDGTAYTAQSDGTVSQLLSYGSHEYRVELFGYKTDAGVIQVGSEKVTKEVTLSSSLATITIQCAMEEADIYVNDEKKGTGTWTGNLAPALYKVEAKREGYQTRLLTLNVRELEVKTVSVPEPVPLYGRVQIQSDPIDATVFIDGVEVGTTPMLSKELQVGGHDVELRKEGYMNYMTTVAVTDTEILPLKVSLVPANYFNKTANTENAVQPTQSLSLDPAKTVAPVKAPKEKKDRTANSKKFYEPTGLYGGYYLYPETGVPVEQFCFYCPTNIQFGAYYKNLNIEFNWSIWMDCCDDLYGYWIITPQDLNGDGVVDGNTSYSYRYIFDDDKHYSVRMGYGIIPFKRLRITPQVGIMYQGMHSSWDSSSELFNDDYTKKSHVLCASVDLKVEISPLRHITMFYTPGFNIPVKMGQIAEKLNENDKIVTRALKGMFQNIGIGIYF